MELHRYWIEFDRSDQRALSKGVARVGCGVTASSRAEAERLIENRIFDGQPMPPVTKFIEGVDITTLDQNHVVPNMGIVVIRGIWFPLGHQE